MKKTILIPCLFAGVLCAFLSSEARAQTVESMPPVVVKTEPQAGAKNVDPATTQIKVTFSKVMSDGSWSWSSAWKDSTPEMIGAPNYDAYHKTCVVNVKLEPNKTYGYWINSQNFRNFKDVQGRPAVPYLFVFKTKSE